MRSQEGRLMFSKISKLERLLKLKELGVLGEHEFERQKQEIINAKPISRIVYVAPLAVLLLAAAGYGLFKHNEAADADRKKQQEAELPIPMVSYKKETKLMWEWTQGYTYTNWGWGGNNSAAVSQACSSQGASIYAEEERGWKIISSNPADKNVQGGTCKGRDIMLEREIPTINIS